MRCDCDGIIEIVIAKYLEANVIKVAKEAKKRGKGYNGGKRRSHGEKSRGKED